MKRKRTVNLRLGGEFIQLRGVALGGFHVDDVECVTWGRVYLTPSGYLSRQALRKLFAVASWLHSEYRLISPKEMNVYLTINDQ